MPHIKAGRVVGEFNFGATVGKTDARHPSFTAAAKAGVSAAERGQTSSKPTVTEPITDDVGKNDPAKSIAHLHYLADLADTRDILERQALEQWDAPRSRYDFQAGRLLSNPTD
jgi:hypothetical protein